MQNETETSPVVTLTDNAARQIQAIISAEKDNQSRSLRIYVEGGGCSGMQYGMVFDDKRAEDQEVKHGEVSVVVDAVSANYLRGAVIDFSDSLTGGGFKISNPNSRHSCGCGKSFEA